MTQNSQNTQNFRACGADEILKVIIYYMTCEKHAMVFLPPEAKILTILKCFHMFGEGFCSQNQAISNDFTAGFFKNVRLRRSSLSGKTRGF